MRKTNNRKRPSAFISHAGVDLKTAQLVEKTLAVAGIDSWLDHSDIRIGALLRKELREAIEASRAMVLLWSKAAAGSRWVASELLMAFHLERFVVPCVLTRAPDLPQFLSRSVFLNFGKARADALQRLCEQVKGAPLSRNEFLGVASYESADLKAAIRDLNDGQRAILDRVGREDITKAKDLQRRLDARMHAAEGRWRFDSTILNLAGYHRKNAYMINHWQEYCAGRFPKDALLEDAERFFFDCLFANPTDYSALNGLGNVLLFEGELDAAEFFVEKAVEWAAADGVDYWEAKHDLRLIRSRTRSTAA
jgi:hypothetical protein